VTIYDFGQAGGFYFLLMEFVDGVNLRHLLRSRKLTPEEALAIVPSLCDALQFAHERGIVHRDIKPENLLLDKTGRIKVADFGIAKMLGAASNDSTGESAAPDNTTKNALGMPGYSAPEQIADPQRVDSRADIYSLGIVFYEMLTGELPGRRIEPPSKKVQVDVRLDAVVLRALEKTPELRWQTAAELRTQVETIATTPVGHSPALDYNPWQPAINIVGMIVCLVLLPVGLILPFPVNLIPFVFASSGIIITGLRISGFWPWRSPLFPNSHWAGRNLHHDPGQPPRFRNPLLMCVVCAAVAILSLLFSFMATIYINQESLEVGRLLNSTNPLDRFSPVIAYWSDAIHLRRYLFVPLCIAGALGTLFFGWFAVRLGKPVRRSLAISAVGLAVVAVIIMAVFLWLSRFGPNVTRIVENAIQTGVAQQLHAAGASYDDLEVTVAENRDTSTPFAVSYKGLRNFKYTFDGRPDPEWPSSADGQFIMSYMGAGQWQGKLGDTQFTVQVGHPDNIDLPFVNDPDLLGDWKTVDYVDDPSQFVPGKSHSKFSLNFDGLTFFENGKTSMPWYIWTKGVVIHTGDQTANHYTIQPIKGETYMFLQLKNGNYLFAGMKPSYFVLQKQPGAWSPPTTEPVSQLTQEGWEFWQERKLAEARVKFQQAVLSDSNNADAWNGLGWTTFNSGDPSNAAQDFQKVLANDPVHPAALNGLGQIYLSEKKYDDAEKYLLKAAPRAPAAWYGLARLYLLEGKYDDAQKWAQQVVDSGQGDQTATQMLQAAKNKQLPDGLRIMIEPQ
jgi:serine/threonine protein kinase